MWTWLSGPVLPLAVLAGLVAFAALSVAKVFKQAAAGRSKRPRDMTVEEWSALPVLGLGVERRVINGASVLVPVLPELRATWFGDDEQTGYIDKDGMRWRFMQREDGTWCRVRLG